MSYHVLTARFFGSNHEVGTADLDDPVNTVAVIQIALDTIDHFEADSSDAAFRIVYKDEIPEEPDPESFGEVIINDAGNAIDIRGITEEVTLYVEKNGNTYSKSISSDISYPLNLLSFDGTFIENLDLSPDKREVRFTGAYRHNFGEFTDGAVGFIYRVNPNNTDVFGNESIFMMKMTHRLGI